MPRQKNDPMVDLLRSVFQPRWDPGKAFVDAIAAHQGLIGLRGFWPGSSIDNTGALYDLSGQGRTLTYNGNPTINLRNILPYLALDGTGDFWSRADEAGLDITGGETNIDAALRGLTIGCWARFDTVGALDCLMGKDDNGSNVSYSLTRTSTGEVQFRISNAGTVIGADSVSSAVQPDDEWHHYIGRFDPSTEVAIFVDGEKTVDTNTIAATTFSGTAAFTLGAFSGGGNPLDGDEALPFLCAAYLPDRLCKWLYHSTKALFNLK